MNHISKAREIHRKAYLKFNPEFLCDYIKFDHDIPIVDTEKIILSTEDEALFCAMLNSMLSWDYTTNIKSTTIYFEVNDCIIYAGAYDELSHMKLTRIAMVTMAGENTTASYTYPDDTFVKIRDKLSKTY